MLEHDINEHYFGNGKRLLHKHHNSTFHEYIYKIIYRLIPELT
jgi:hypothetical protein